MARSRGRQLVPESMSVRPAFALFLLIRVDLRCHFLAPTTPTQGWLRNAMPRNGAAKQP